ncbi:MAG: YbhB/YbcL family Raf kinase inhibitor-like protein [Candidatus Methanomethylophilus sp.]|nr:YbhB/YbcL family Raf kinase inhibitor-like protein [Methanomethylophilus sp.]
MKVTSAAFTNGRIADEYGSRGTEFGTAGMPVRSFPLEISDAPAGTASFALIFDDPDSRPTCGFTWVHWLVAGLKYSSLPADASRTDGRIIQGANSWNGHGTDLRGSSVYGGPCPSDRPHTYVLRVLALDFEPALKPGFSYEALTKVAKNHILAKAELRGLYEPA